LNSCGIACTSIAFLNLLQLPQEIPEFGFGTNFIGCPKLHAVNLRVLIGFRWKTPSDDPVLVKLCLNHFYDEQRFRLRLAADSIFAVL
jgi:hypothetical protein